MVEDFINGQAKNPTFMREISRVVKEMEEEHSGGQMAAGMKVNLKKDCKVDKELFIEMEIIRNMKDFGITECLMERVFSSSRMVKGMKEHLSKINSMEMEYSTRKIQ